MAVAFSREPAPLGTGGALRLALPLLGTDPVMAMNGDSLCAADLGEFLRAHRASRFDISILLARVPDAGRFGTVDLAPDGTIRGFFEKYGEGGPAWINAGAYLVRRGVLEAIPEGRPFSLERDLFPARAGQAMGGHRTGAPFIDIGTPDSLRACEAFLDALHAGEPRPTKE
jgi:NDP-sugar pyrophosphorylase family protein